MTALLLKLFLGVSDHVVSWSCPLFPKLVFKDFVLFDQISYESVLFVNLSSQLRFLILTLIQLSFQILHLAHVLDRLNIMTRKHLFYIALLKIVRICEIKLF